LRLAGHRDFSQAGEGAVVETRGLQRLSYLP
jgi:hypothetical protein